MVLGAHLEYVLGSLPGPPASSSRSDEANAAADELASLRPEVVHLRLSSQIIEHIALQLDDTTDDGGLQVDVETDSISFVVGSRSFPLSRSSEYTSTPHDLFKLCSLSSSTTEPTPLLSIGPIAYQLSARATTGASDLAAERLRLKERRDEEDARRTSNSAVLLEPSQIGGKKGKKADRSKSVISNGASPAIRRSAPLGLASAYSTQQNTRVNSKNDALSAAQQAESNAFSATDPSLRTRLIQLLAMSPISLSAITSQLGSSAAPLLPSLASQDGQQMYVLKDDLCVEVRIAEWPGYTDAEVRRAVSDRVNLGLRKRRVGRSHEAWSRLWPDGKIQRVVGASETERNSAEQQQSEAREAEGVQVGSEPAEDHDLPATAAAPKKKKPTTLQRVAKAAKGKKSASTVTAAAKQRSSATVKAASKVASSPANGRADKDRQAAKGADDADLPNRKKARLHEPKSTEVTAAAKKTASAQRARSPALERIPRRAESSNAGKPSSTTSSGVTSSSASRKQQAVDKAAAAAEAKRKRLEERARNLDYTDSSEEEVGRDHASSHTVSASSTRRGRSHSRPSRDIHAGRDASTSHSQRTAERPRSEAPAQHRGVGPGAHAHSEPWLDIRTTADFARLAERFRRDYAEYSAGKDRVRKEGEWLEAEKKAIEIEEQTRMEEEKARAEREKEQRAAIAAAAAAAATSTSASVEADESPEEGETSPVIERDMEHFHQGSFSDASRGGAPARSASTNPTTRSPSPAATWRDANEAVGKELSIAAASAAAAGDSGGVGTAIGPPMGPMTYVELEKLVRRVRDLEGQLWRMKRALVDFKRRVEGTEWDRDRGDGRDRNRDSGRDWERGRDRDRDWRGERQRS